MNLIENSLLSNKAQVYVIRGPATNVATVTQAEGSGKVHCFRVAFSCLLFTARTRQPEWHKIKKNCKTQEFYIRVSWFISVLLYCKVSQTIKYIILGQGFWMYAKIAKLYQIGTKCRNPWIL